MNAIILSALWGVLMMYTGFATKNTRTVSVVALLGVLAVLVVNWMEYLGLSFFNIDTRGMLAYNGFGLIFNTVVLFSTLVYFLLSGREIEKAGKTPSDLYALIFFILSGISIIAGFKSLLMLFIGIEIISIPLYVLAGSDKSNLKSNEAALKYFLMGSFSTGIMLMGIAFLYGDAGTFYLEGVNAGLGALTPMKAIGMVLLLASMSFKVSAAPRTQFNSDVTSAEFGWLHCGPPGAGHFVKMVHNGIEYGMMQAYAEGFNIIKNANAGAQYVREGDAEVAPMADPESYCYDIDVAEVAELWRRGSVVGSWLLDLTADVLRRDGILEQFSGGVSDSGEGRWTVSAAVDLGVPAPVITTALFERFNSRNLGSFGAKILNGMRYMFGGHHVR